jgi:hypothetical protein
MSIHSRPTTAALVALVVCAALASCQGDETSGTGGSATTSTAASGGGGTGGAGAGPECAMPSDCGVDTTCQTRLCEAGTCGVQNAELGTECADDGGVICDGRGACVAASCSDGIRDGDETDVDCGGSCGACGIGGECIFPDDCVSQTCDAGICIACPNDVPCDLLGAFFCAPDGSCQPEVAQGADCTLDGGCLSGFCADGKCCDAACDGPCDHCDMPAGTCTVDSAGAAAAACAPYVCDGVNVACPGTCSSDANCVMMGFCDVNTNICVAAQKPQGLTCDFPNECQSGFCVDGVCCAAAGCPGDCNSCAVPGQEGQCAPMQVGTTCRVATGTCDIAELCDGIVTTCPNDAIEMLGTTCRASVGGCDPPELCDGATKACLSDIVANMGDSCRPAVGLCDIAESCDGTNGQCPFDALVVPGVSCRAAIGECDPEELCDGLMPTCPIDAFELAGTACGNGVAEPICDPDSCDGAGVCQDAAPASGGTSCADDALFCSGPETCGVGLCTSGGDPCVLPAACDETNDACVEVWINELHYDNVSTDVAEGIEVAGTAGTDLTNWQIVLYNGNGGVPYGTINLGGSLPNQQAGLGTAFFAQPGIQNGGPDGLALVAPTGVVVQFLSYEGSFTATSGPANGLASADIGVAESTTDPAGMSLQLIGTGSSYVDFAWTGPAASSSGAINSSQIFQ